MYLTVLIFFLFLMAQEEKNLYVGIEYVCLSGRVGELGSQETAGTDSAVCPWQSGCPCSEGASSGPWCNTALVT